MVFLAFEGLDGSGKSTLIQRLGRSFQEHALAFVVTREPGGTPLGEEVRALLLRTQGEAPSPRAELLLYEAIRAHHVDTKIRPALKEGKWVFCDRYAASTVAFQCGARGLDFKTIESLNAYATDGCEPDLWVLVDVPVAESLRRLGHRAASGQGEKDRFGNEQMEFHERVRASYLDQARREPQKWLVLDGLQSPDTLGSDLLSELRRRQWLSF